MADSNITKRALAAALRDLMEEIPFEKINVAQICEKCGMNRKSFYYHFKDKYDLVNWIFDIEFIEIVTSNMNAATHGAWVVTLEKLCQYFYVNRSFYQKALKIKGQNSFLEHFQESIYPFLKNRLSHLLGEDKVDEFFVDFFSDAYLCALKRWLQDSDMPPEEFVSRLDGLAQAIAISICREMEEDGELARASRRSPFAPSSRRD